MRGDGILYKPRKDKSSVWWGQYYGHGKRQRFSTGERDRKRAMKMLQQRVALVRTGRALPEDLRRLRYDDLERTLLDDYRINGRRTLRDLPRVLARLRVAFAGCPVLNITTPRIQQYTTERLDEGAAPATINKELSALGRMLTLAVRDGRLPARPQVPKLHADNARAGFVEPADFDALCAALPEHLRVATRFAYLSGWRKGEVFGLTWAQVDVDGGTIRLEAAQSKNRQGRVLAFAPDTALAEVLVEQSKRRRADCPYVFHRNGQRIRYFYSAWRSACARIGRVGLLFHDLRRSSVRNMVRAGIPERICMARTGHKTRSVFDRYNIVSEKDLREADARVSAYLRDREPSNFGHTGRRVVALDEVRDAASA
jgi:integrase